MTYDEIKFKFLEFEKSLNEFMPIAENIKKEGIECYDYLLKFRRILETCTEEQIKEINDIGYRLDDLCEKISDMF